MSETTTWWIVPSWESLMQRHEAATGKYRFTVTLRCAPGGNQGYERMHARDGFDRVHPWVAEGLVGAAAMESCYAETIRAALEFNTFPTHYAPRTDGGGRASRLAVCGAELKQRRRGRRAAAWVGPEGIGIPGSPNQATTDALAVTCAACRELAAPVTAAIRDLERATGA